MKMERPPIYTMDDDDLLFLNPQMRPEDPRRRRIANRLRTTAFIATDTCRRGQRGQRYMVLHLRDKSSQNTLRYYYEMVAQNVQGPRLLEVTAIDRFLIATVETGVVGTGGGERLVVPAEVFEREAFRTGVSLDDLFEKLWRGLSCPAGVALLRNRLLSEVMCESQLYIACPPREGRPPNPHKPREMKTFYKELSCMSYHKPPAVCRTATLRSRANVTRRKRLRDDTRGRRMEEATAFKRIK